MRVIQRVYRGKLGPPKTEASRAVIPAPKIVCTALERWRAECRNTSPESFIFASKHGSPINVYNFLQRNLHPAELCAGIRVPVTHQMLRRTWTTHTRPLDPDLKITTSVLRHSEGENLAVSVYQQTLWDRVRNVMNKFAQMVASDLPDVEELPMPVEEELRPELVQIGAVTP